MQHAASAGKLMVGTVKGDLLDIGKNLVDMMLAAAAGSSRPENSNLC